MGSGTSRRVLLVSNDSCELKYGKQKDTDSRSSRSRGGHAARSKSRGGHRRGPPPRGKNASHSKSWATVGGSGAVRWNVLPMVHGASSARVIALTTKSSGARWRRAVGSAGNVWTYPLAIIRIRG